MYSPLTNTVSTARSDQRHQQPITFERGFGGIALSGGKILVVTFFKIMVLTPHED